MIGCLRGEIIEKYEASLLVMTAGGVGYEVFVPNHSLDQSKGSSVFMFTTLIVRETAMTLFGFETEKERMIFNTLIGVNGVGPKGAISILNLGAAERLQDAIANKDSSFVAQAKGIGQKTAEKVIIELQDKMHGSGVEYAGLSTSSEVVDALTGLGYDQFSIQKVLKNVDHDLPAEEQIKFALKMLARY